MDTFSLNLVEAVVCSRVVEAGVGRSWLYVIDDRIVTLLVIGI